MSVPTPPENLIRQQNRGFSTFHISEIYSPSAYAANPEKARYVPNVDDLIIDYQAGFYRCTATDYTTGLSTLQRWTPPRQNDLVSDQDILLGSGPGRPSESFRAYLDTSVTPFSLSLDARLHMYGTGNRYAKFFRGTDTGQNGDVISRFYDQSGNYLGENIPLEIVGMDNVSNIAIQTPVVAYTLTNMEDGETVSVVIYDDAGNVRSINPVLVKNTSFVRTVDMSLEYIVDIALESPYLSSSDPTTLEVPLNMPVMNIPMMGLVTYNSGRQARVPVDGAKFEVLGIENYIATRAGQTIPIALSYKIGPGEHSYSMTPSVNNHITKQYQLRTMNPDTAYKVKLFAFPEWVDALNGYRLKFYLTNLTRDYLWEVTSKVTAGVGSRAYNPTQYAVLQRCSFMINLQEVDSRFTAYNHVETFDIVLSGPPNNMLTTMWGVGFEPNQEPSFGDETWCSVHYNNPSSWSVEMASGETTLANWLAKMFQRTIPLKDENSEVVAPNPTHFYLNIANERELYPIAQWNAVLTTHEGDVTGKNIYLEFIRRVSNNDLRLGVAAVPIRRL